MKIYLIEEDKRKYLPLLLLADEQESMIDRYLDRGTLYVLEDEDVKTAGVARNEEDRTGNVKAAGVARDEEDRTENVKAVCVVTDEGEGVLEIKNLAVEPKSQRKGYGRAMLHFIKEMYRDSFSIFQVGTGDSPLTIPFYEKCGFRRFHVIKNFFIDNYDHPIYEDGKQLVDMIILRQEIQNYDTVHSRYEKLEQKSE